MPLTLDWRDVALRLALTVVVGLLFGYDRGGRGKAAGMRTTLLVCLAAAVAMIQVNLLLPMAGRPATSFVQNDLMRLPLGILTGVGFIGAGAILRRDTMVIGVTTAATLWLVTVIGLCFGGGQIALGMIAAAIGMLGLWGVRAIEERLHQEHRARLAIEFDAQGPSEAEIRRRLAAEGLAITATGMSVESGGARRSLSIEVREHRRYGESGTPAIIDALAAEPGVRKVEWRPLA